MQVSVASRASASMRALVHEPVGDASGASAPVRARYVGQVLDVREDLQDQTILHSL